MSRPPNILFLLPDQLRPDFLGCYGAGFLKTPNIDALASAGTLYETCISPAPICVPARATMLTGQAAEACGVMDNLHWPRPDRAEMGVRTWPEILSEAGYATLAIGKMHFYPWDVAEGFGIRVIAEDKRHIHIQDDYLAALQAEGFTKQHADAQRGYRETRGAALSDLPDHLQIDRWVAAQAADALLTLDPDRSFAMMVGFPGPHCPYDPPETALASIDAENLPQPLPSTEESRSHHAAFVASYKRPWANLDYSNLSAAEALRLRHHYAALVERLDADVGRLIEILRKAGHLDNTIVVFASDHGDYLGDFGLVGKTYFHEPSIRVPLIVTDFRADPAPRRTSALTSIADLYPSIMGWAGCELPAHAVGMPLSKDGTPERIVTGLTAQGGMARSKRFKLVRYRNGTEALFDLALDPTEQTDVIDRYPQARSELDAALMQAILSGFDAAHSDKRVPQSQATSDHPFYRRGWRRPYPAG